MKKQTFKAQTLVEFALILPIALFLILGFFDIGRAIFNYATLTNMVREGARFAISDSTATTGPYLNTITHINDFAFSIPDLPLVPTSTNCFTISSKDANSVCTFTGTDIIVVITRIWSSSSNTFENIEVKATLTFKPVTPFIADMMGNGTSMDLVAKSTMRLSGSVR
jgi:Flp pilus assembly protein TadG